MVPQELSEFMERLEGLGAVAVGGQAIIDRQRGASEIAREILGGIAHRRDPDAVDAAHAAGLAVETMRMIAMHLVPPPPSAAPGDMATIVCGACAAEGLRQCRPDCTIAGGTAPAADDKAASPENV
jgi:hypothetical protein